MQGQVSVAAATAVIGYDLLTGVTWAVSSRRRRLVAAGLAGSAAALDTKIRLMSGTDLVSEMFNAGTGAPNRDSMMRVGETIPAGRQLFAIVDDAPATNPIKSECGPRGPLSKTLELGI